MSIIHKPHYQNIPFEVPDGWCWAKIIDIAVLKSGGQYQTSYDENSYLYIKVSDMNRINNLTEITISDVRCTCKTSELVPTNSIIFPKRGGAILTNKKRLNIKYPIAIDSNIMALTPFSGIELFYVRLWLESFDLSRLWTGNVVPQINNQDIYPLSIPIPPLAEQRRIVSAIESAFAVIDELERNKTDLQSAVAATKQKILSLAIRGKFVKQDPNDEPASVLLERIRSEREKLISEGKIKRGKGDSAVIRSDDNCYYEKIPDGWSVCRLGDVCEIARGGSPRPIQDYITNDSNGINWIKIGDTAQGNKYITEAHEKICPEGLNHSRFVRAGDFLLTNSMSFGRPYILKIDGCIHDGWLVINDVQKVFTPDFLYHLLSSDWAYQSLSVVAYGSTVKNLKSDTVKAFTVPIPPFAEQYRIVAAIEAAFEQLDNIAAALM